MTPVLHCRSYTHARRFPLVIGKVGGYALPTPLTPAQVVVLLGSAALLLATRGWWAVLPAPTGLVVVMTLPVLLTCAVRHARIEGRTPARAALGALTYLTRPRRGRRGGRRVGAVRPVRVRQPAARPAP